MSQNSLMVLVQPFRPFQLVTGGLKSLSWPVVSGESKQVTRQREASFQWNTKIFF